jgi:hypothetical protein
VKEPQSSAEHPVPSKLLSLHNRIGVAKARQRTSTRAARRSTASAHSGTSRPRWVWSALAVAAMTIAAVVVVAQTSAPAGAAGPQAAEKKPSKLATMVCAPKTAEEIGQIVALHETVVGKTWLDHRYSCRYRFKIGTMVLSVKELSSWSQTIGYFRSLEAQLRRKQSLYGLGQGAFETRDGSVVVRKDWKVLVVDTSRLPGEASSSTSNIALAVAAAIMECWHGD